MQKKGPRATPLSGLLVNANETRCRRTSISVATCHARLAVITDPAGQHALATKALKRNKKRPDALRLVARPASKSILTFRLSDSTCGPIASCIRSRSSVITGFGGVFGHFRLGFLPAANALIRARGCDWTTETLTNDSVSVTSL